MTNKACYFMRIVLLADDSHEISYLSFAKNWEKMSQNLSSAAVVIGALRVNTFTALNA